MVAGRGGAGAVVVEGTAAGGTAAAMGKVIIAVGVGYMFLYSFQGENCQSAG
jgi:hypothetical protein